MLAELVAGMGRLLLLSSRMVEVLSVRLVRKSSCRVILLRPPVRQAR